MKIAAALTTLVVVRGSFARKAIPNRLNHHRLLLDAIEPSFNLWRKQNLASDFFQDDEAFWSRRFMLDFSTLSLSLGTVAPATAASTPAPSPGFPTNRTPSPGSPTSNAPPTRSPRDNWPSSGPPSTVLPSSGQPAIGSDTPSDMPSLAPSVGPTPTTFQAETVFGCTPGGVRQIPPPYIAISVLSFQFEYLVESTKPIETFQASLESILFLTAVSGALQCSKGTSLLEQGALYSVEISTIQAYGSCTSNKDAADVLCYRLTTSFDVAVAEELDPGVAVFLGYIFLRDELDGGMLENNVPDVVRGQYLAPLPTLPNNVEEDDDSVDEDPPVSAESRLSVSAWTVGAVAAMSLGGLLAIAAWFRNRATRNRRHMHLIEETSLASPISEA